METGQVIDFHSLASLCVLCATDIYTGICQPILWYLSSFKKFGFLSTYCCAIFILHGL